VDTSNLNNKFYEWLCSMYFSFMEQRKAIGFNPLDFANTETAIWNKELRVQLPILNGTWSVEKS